MWSQSIRESHFCEQYVIVSWLIIIYCHGSSYDSTVCLTNVIMNAKILKLCKLWKVISYVRCENWHSVTQSFIRGLYLLCPRPHREVGIIKWALVSVRPSVCVSVRSSVTCLDSRTERPRKPKIGRM